MISLPKARKKNRTLEAHADKRIDPYYWMKERDNPEVLNYLKAENAYYQAETAHTKTLQKALFEEMKSRIKLDDESVPYFLNGYWYYLRFIETGGYPIYCRKKGNLKALEEVLFDASKMAEKYDYFDMGEIHVSPNNKLAAYSVDNVSRRNYTIQIKDLEGDRILSDSIENTTGEIAWANDNRTFFYVKRDEQTLRSYQVYRHILGQKANRDKLVYEELDEKFSVGIYTSKSRQYIVLASSSTISDEYWVLSTDQPEGDFRVIQNREQGLEYDILHFKEDFYILTNKDGSTNFKLMKTPVHKTEKESWVDVIPHRKNVLLEDVDIFKDFLVLSERVTGLTKIRIIRWDWKEDYYLPIESQTYSIGTGHNPEFNTSVLRYGFSSLTTPDRVVEYDMTTHKSKVRKERQILDPDFDKTDYYSKRVWAKSEDGTRVPISLVYKRGIRLDGKNPLLLYGYGSYGVTIDPSFSSARLSLLDRGFIFAIAHVRGGEYLGRKWYKQGKLEHKMNTFTDFIACSKYLIQLKYTSPEHLYAMGGSAGGLLMGVILNKAPQLYHGVIAEVPFVDVLTTMLDDTIPLTIGEYEEWGDPNKKTAYQTIKAYSPYDNVMAQAYPNILVTTGFHDSQVQYWEPAKWVAKLRDLKTDDNKLFFHINMEAGHGGASGRFESLKEIAEDYAFLLNLEGKK